MNSNCGRPRVLGAARVIAVVALALAVAPAAYANGWNQMTRKLEQLAFMKQIWVALVVYAAVVSVVAWYSLRAAARSTRPRENKLAAWSLILGVLPLAVMLPHFALGLLPDAQGGLLAHGLKMVTLPARVRPALWGAGPLALLTGIKAYRIGGSRWMAVPGIVLGVVDTVALVGIELLSLLSILTLN